MKCSLSSSFSLSLSFSPTSSQFSTPVNKDLRMGSLHRANSGLACSLGELAQNSAASLSPRKGTASSEPIPRLKAITILIDQNEDNVLAYLKFARSLHHNAPYFPGHGSLSHDQYLAVCALRDCSDAEIRSWFKEIRKPRESVRYLLNPQDLTPTDSHLLTAQ